MLTGDMRRPQRTARRRPTLTDAVRVSPGTQGGDASNAGRESAFFNIKSVPEVFAYFDALSYELSSMDLSAFRRNAMRNDIVRSDNTPTEH